MTPTHTEEDMEHMRRILGGHCRLVEITRPVEECDPAAVGGSKCRVCGQMNTVMNPGFHAGGLVHITLEVARA